jgi:endonuclease YncB( thermonuclease family)
VEKRQVKVRLASIDAPELGQPYGRASREALLALCAGKAADVADQGNDRYGRTIGRVTCDKHDTSAAQVRAGMAWVFNRYVRPADPLYELQDEAKSERRGLWSDAYPIAPWEWRNRDVRP